ncbi:hypothetical protein [Sphaerisporangium fuscum]|uniref:hypothetical protein n=1 Tax=Sphaerisporangium fuscum TaxID=2835868 RepID=UPI001BDD507D|nr:hypothetical protein [Sphaerisporangium fuscum]
MRRAALLLVVPLLALATACGGTSTSSLDASSSGGSAAAPSDAWLKYAKCVREHGVKDFPDDPKNLPQGGMQIPDKASKACEKLMEGVGQRVDTKDPKYLDKMTKLARCMREHGIDFPDPGPNGQLPPPGFNGGNQAKFDAAGKACASAGESQ